MSLAVERLSFAYRRSEEAVLTGLDHTFSTGAITAITGPSGRGKSTLLYLLGLMLRPSSGSIRLDGADVGSLPDAGRSRVRATRLGFVFQDAALEPSRTILDAVIEPGLYAGLAPRVRRTRAAELLDRLGLAERAGHRPGQISGGQAQRVAVARALMNDPAVILADEPTGNLDRGNAEVVLDALRDAGQGRTVLIATHDPFVLEHVDEVLAL